MPHTVEDSAPKPGSSRFTLPVLLALWVLALVPGVRFLLAYETTAGKQGAAPAQWPAGELYAGDARLPTLVVALHPRCSCSGATLKELQRVSAGMDRPFNTVLLIDQPKGADAAWRDQDLYREAQVALHARVLPDVEGRMAMRFGAYTSGEVLVYAAEDSHTRRALLFHGGVTGSRGMEGDNVGIESFRDAMVTGTQAKHAQTPVFGCGLFASNEAGREEAGKARQDTGRGSSR